MRRIILCAVIAALAACGHLANEPLPVYIIFFHKDSVEVAPESRAVLDRAAVAIRKMHTASVAIASGVATGDNLRLAEPRYGSIRQALVAHGVDAKLIARSALPDAKLNVGATGDQRVEILLLATPPS